MWIFNPRSKFWICNFVKIYRKCFKNSPFLSPFWLAGTGLVPIISQCFPTGYFCINLENMCQEILLHPKEIYMWLEQSVGSGDACLKPQHMGERGRKLMTSWQAWLHSEILSETPSQKKNNRLLAKTGMVQVTSLSTLNVRVGREEVWGNIDIEMPLFVRSIIHYF